MNVRSHAVSEKWIKAKNPLRAGVDWQYGLMTSVIRICRNGSRCQSEEESIHRLSAPRSKASQVEHGIPNFHEIYRKAYKLYIQRAKLNHAQVFSILRVASQRPSPSYSISLTLS